MKPILLAIFITFAFTIPSKAGQADVIEAQAIATAKRIYTFEVTVQHADTGWKHYADRWEVLAPDGSVLGTRVLHHPHEHEQPFKRSLSGVKIPAHIERVTVRARDSKHGWGGGSITVKLPQTE